MNTLPLTTFQERLWFEWQSNPSSSAYNVVLRFDLRGRLNQSLLHEAVMYVTTQHEILRTSFIDSNGDGLQIINDQASFEFKFVDLQNKQTSLDHVLSNYLLKPFSTENKCPHRYILVKLEENLHVFALSWHHIIVDAKSMQLFLDALSSTYNLLLNKKSLHHKPDVSMSLILKQEKLLLNNRKLEKGLSYWSHNLLNAQFFTPLFSNTRTIKQSVKADRKVLHLNTTISNALFSFSNRHKVSTFAIMTSLLAACLNRFTLEEDLVIGYSVDVREKYLEKKMGFFVNNLMLKININNKMSLTDLVHQVVMTRKKDKLYQDIPLPLILKRLRMSGQYSEDPLPNIWINQYTALSYNLSLDKIETTPVLLDEIESQHDFILSFNSEKVITAELSYNTKKFRKEYIESFCASFIKIAEIFAFDPDQPISIINLSKAHPPKEYLKIREKNILELFAESASLYPNDIAIYSQYEKLTYKELDSQSDAVALYLSEMKIGRGDIVCVSASSSINMICTVLGILKCGAAYVGIDPDLPIARVNFILNDTKSQHFLIDSNLSTKFSNIQDKHVIFLDAITNTVNINNKINLPVLDRNDLAYIVYTSGSTGTPKGVMVEHRSLTNLIQIVKQDVGLLQSDKVLQFASISFDSFVWEWAPTLALGASLYILDSKINNSSKMEYFFCVANNIDVTIATLPPSVISSLSPDKSLKLLRILISAGEACNDSIINNWKDRLRLINGYGPTEGTVCTTLFTAQSGYPSNTIGKPVNNICTYLFNSSLSVTPIGGIGEVYIGGENLARGYLNQDDLTQAKFIYFDNFTPSIKSPVRLYRSGDLARLLHDGNMEYVGRMDAQVKIRGNRVELGEIENRILMFGEVKNAFVLACDRQDTKLLIAFLVFKNIIVKNDLVIEKIQSYLETILPAYMIPNRFIQLDSLPLMVTGKVDTKKLLDIINFNKEVGFNLSDEQLCAKEKTIMDVWKNVLNLEKIDKKDNYFELGGDSILSIKIVTLCKQKGVEFSVADLFEFPTIESLAANIKSQEIPVNAAETSFSLLSEEDKKKLGL